MIAVLRDAWPAWVAVAGVVFATVLGFQLSHTKSAGVRYAGMVLQIMGLATVAIGLSQVRQLFGRPSLLWKVLTWFRRIAAAFCRPKPTVVQANTGTIAIRSGRARVMVRASPEDSLDRRVALLEENLYRLQDEVDAKEKEFKKELGTVRDALGQEQRSRETEDRKVSAKLEELAIGGLHLEFVGLIWLALGVLGTSIPDEIACLL